MNRGVIVAVAGVLMSGSLAVTGAQQATPVVEVYKSPTCGCCLKWVGHLRQSGLTVRATEMPDKELVTFKASHGVPLGAQSCHTALVGGYVIEGHVPATDIRRILQERPAILGLAVPGMPPGAPGMEVPRAAPQSYSVFSFDKQGNRRVFMSHGR